MPVEILVPPLSQTMDSLVLREWVKKVGDPVLKGEILYRVETDKAMLEIEAPASGTLFQIYAQADEEVKVLSSIGLILEEGETAPLQQQPKQVSAQIDAPPSAPAPDEASLDEAPMEEAPLEPRLLGKNGRAFASPRARLTAIMAGIDLTQFKGQGSGPQKVIIARDVRAFLEQRKPPTQALVVPVPDLNDVTQPGETRPVSAVPDSAPPEKAAPREATPLARRMAQEAGLDLNTITPAKVGAVITRADVEATLQHIHPGSIPASTQEIQTVSLSPTRRIIARRMRESLSNNAPVTYMSAVDATRLAKLRRRILEALPDDALRPTYTDLLVFLTARLLGKFPQLNATFDGNHLDLHKHVDMALAVENERGLIVPVLRNAETLGLAELARLRTELVSRAIHGSSTPADLAGGSFTLSNLGTMGIDFFTPIINPPQVAILGVGRLREQPAMHKGKVSIRSMMSLSITCDHRVIDGAPAARFLQELCRLVENPYLMWL